MRRVNCIENNAGISLIAAIVIVTIISFLGLLTTSLFTNKRANTTVHLASMRAQFIAEGGLERGIKRYKDTCKSDPPGYSGEDDCSLDFFLSSERKWAKDSGKFDVHLSKCGPPCFPCPSGSETLSANQRCIRSTGRIAGATRVIDQMVTCPGSPLSEHAATSEGNTISLYGGAKILCPSPPARTAQTCAVSVDAGAPCSPCVMTGSSALAPVATPGGLSAPSSGCEYNGSTSTLQPGKYYCSSFHLNKSSTVNITANGNVTIYTNNFEMNKSSNFNWSAPSASNLLVIVTPGGNAQLNDASNFRGAIYAPDASVSLNATAEIVGAVAAKSINMYGPKGSRITWDATAGQSAFDYPTAGNDAMVLWREAPP